MKCTYPLTGDAKRAMIELRDTLRTRWADLSDLALELDGKDEKQYHAVRGMADAYYQTIATINRNIGKTV